MDWQRKLYSVGKWTGLGLVILMLGALLFGEMGFSRYLQLRDHAEQLDQELTDLQRLNNELRADLDRVQYDPSRIEELARERLGYVRKGETVYQLAPLGDKERTRGGRRHEGRQCCNRGAVECGQIDVAEPTAERKGGDRLR